MPDDAPGLPRLALRRQGSDRAAVSASSTRMTIDTVSASARTETWCCPVIVAIKARLMLPV